MPGVVGVLGLLSVPYMVPLSVFIVAIVRSENDSDVVTGYLKPVRFVLTVWNFLWNVKISYFSLIVLVASLFLVFVVFTWFHLWF